MTSPTRDGFGTNGDDLGIPDLDKLMSIYYSVEEVWKFNKERFGQDSWDGRGTEIRSFGLQGKETGRERLTVWIFRLLVSPGPKRQPP